MRSSDASKIPLRPSFFRRPLLTSKVDLNLPVVKSNEFQTSQQQNNDAGEKQQHCIIKDEEIKTFGRIKYYTTFSLIENDRGDTFLDAKIYCLSIGQDLSLYRVITLCNSTTPKVLRFCKELTPLFFFSAF